MILMGTYQNLPPEFSIDDLIIYNFTSPLMGFPNINLLPPPQLDYTFDNTFDQMYYDYMINCDGAFMELMKLIMAEYHNKNIYLIVSEGNGYDYINESLAKLIQVRYGIVIQYINDIEDYNELRWDSDVSFSIFGMDNLIGDKERYTSLYEQMYGIEVDSEGLMVNPHYFLR